MSIMKTLCPIVWIPLLCLFLLKESKNCDDRVSTATTATAAVDTDLSFLQSPLPQESPPAAQLHLESTNCQSSLTSSLKLTQVGCRQKYFSVLK